MGSESFTVGLGGALGSLDIGTGLPGAVPLPDFNGGLINTADGLNITLDVPLRADTLASDDGKNPFSEIDSIVSQAGVTEALEAAGIDRLDIAGVGNQYEINSASAQNLINAGLGFADNDTITLAVDGATQSTQLSTSLKDLQKIGIDAVSLWVARALRSG